MGAVNLYERRFVLFSGKGGVGKTTVASAFALSCARRGERTLLMELNVRDRVCTFFGADIVGTDIVELEDNLYAVNTTPEAAIEEYGLMILRVRMVYRAVFENRIVKTFLKSVPGLNELVLLGKAYFHAAETNDDGSPVWDKVVVDAPATGHGMFLLQIPQVITSLVGSGHMYDEAVKIVGYLQDPELTALNLVTLAEDMPVNETVMLYEQVRDDLGIPVGCIIANGLVEPLFEPSEAELLERAHDEVEDPDLDGLVDAARFRQRRCDAQSRHLQRLRELIDRPVLEVPYYFVERIDYPTIRSIADTLSTQSDALDEEDSK